MNKAYISKWKDRAMDFVFPPRCPICDRVTGKKIGELCDDCIEGPYPERVEDPFCLRCGKQLEKEDVLYCYDCSGLERGFKSGRAPFQYRGMEPCMYRFKNGGRPEFAVYLGGEMAQLYLSELGSWKSQVLIPIPVHPSRKRVRGYNQAALLAHEMGKRIGIPVDETLLIRKKKTKVQRYMDDWQRLMNLQGAFETTRPCEYERICLIDDIYTTGATCETAARVLLFAGAKEVRVLCACIGRGK